MIRGIVSKGSGRNRLGFRYSIDKVFILNTSFGSIPAVIIDFASVPHLIRDSRTCVSIDDGVIATVELHVKLICIYNETNSLSKVKPLFQPLGTHSRASV